MPRDIIVLSDKLSNYERGIEMKKIIAVILSLVTVMLCVVMPVSASSAPEIDEYGFIDVGDCEIEYGIYGIENTQPLVLLPGNSCDMHNFDGNILYDMAQHYKVICISPRGNGNSGRGEGRLTFELYSDDLAKVLDALGIEKTYIFGFSDGGNFGLVFTLRYPERVEKLAINGANINTRGTKTFSQLRIEWQYFILCIEAFLTNDPEFARQRDIKGMMVGQPTLTFSDLENIKIPVLNMYGEHDMMFRWHSEKITASIPDCKGVMIKGASHGGYEYSDTVIIPELLAFFG